MKIQIKKYSATAVFSVLYLISAFVFSVIAYFLNLTDEILSISGFVLSVGFILLSAVFSARKADKKGWLTGMISGMIFTLTVLLISLVLCGGNISPEKLFIRLPLYIFVSFIGGIMGINMK